MSVVPLQDILRPAFDQRYGVPAINIFNDLTLAAVLDGATKARSPLIVQTSVKTVRSIGVGVLAAMWRAMTADVDVPVTLHLDHCPDRKILSACLAEGWNSVLFDASELSVVENQRQTVEVVAEARRYGAAVEGEIEAITGVEDGHGSDEEARRVSLETALEFLRATGVDVFAPSIGNAHGIYKQAPVLDYQRVSDIVESHPVPIALHGGSGLTSSQFRDLISRGCAKVNISTSLKETYLRSNLVALRNAEESGKWDPPTVFASTRSAVIDLVVELAEEFGSSGRAD